MNPDAGVRAKRDADDQRAVTVMPTDNGHSWVMNGKS